MKIAKSEQKEKSFFAKYCLFDERSFDISQPHHHHNTFVQKMQIFRFKVKLLISKTRFETVWPVVNGRGEIIATNQL